VSALDVNGTVTATGFAGNASGLTNLSATQLAGTLSLAQLPSAVGTNNSTGLNLAGTCTGNGAGITNLSASGVTSALAAAGQSAVPSGGLVLAAAYPDANLLNAGYVKLGRMVVDDLWEKRVSATALDARAYHTAVWTGTEMIIWGGGGTNGYDLNDGWRYDPTANSWTPISTNGAPSAREMHSAVWTGNEMIVWGGAYYDGDYHYLNDGGRYNPATDTWTALSTNNAPAARWMHTAVWTGNEMIVWGGYGVISSVAIPFNSGGRYNPIANTWTAVSTNSAPVARAYHTAVWTGTAMIVWGGNNLWSGYYNDGGRYDPIANTWTAVSTTGAPSERLLHKAVWTGSEMVVWGGELGGFLNTGGRYDPAADTWTTVNTTGAPSGRRGGTVVWTGSEMIIWGGVYVDATWHWLNNGGRYNPTANAWAALTTTAAPAGRWNHTAVWTGSEMIIFGGVDDAVVYNDAFGYSPPRSLYLYQRQ